MEELFKAHTINKPTSEAGITYVPNTAPGILPVAEVGVGNLEELEAYASFLIVESSIL